MKPLFSHFLATMEVVVQDAKAANKFSEGEREGVTGITHCSPPLEHTQLTGIVDVAGESIELKSERTIHVDAASGAEVKHRIVVTVSQGRGGRGSHC